jgi:hypothetical protein
LSPFCPLSEFLTPPYPCFPFILLHTFFFFSFFKPFGLSRRHLPCFFDAPLIAPSLGPSISIHLQENGGAGMSWGKGHGSVRQCLDEAPSANHWSREQHQMQSCWHPEDTSTACFMHPVLVRVRIRTELKNRAESLLPASWPRLACRDDGWDQWAGCGPSA